MWMLENVELLVPRFHRAVDGGRGVVIISLYLRWAVPNTALSRVYYMYSVSSSFASSTYRASADDDDSDAPQTPHDA